MLKRLQRLWAVITKEFIQMRRDRSTLAMIIGIPIIQLILFGYAINLNPRYLPTAIVGIDDSVLTRRILTSLEHSSYFRFIGPPMQEAEAEHLLKTTQIQFIVHIPPHFSHDVVRGLNPQLLLEADATDPAATTRAVSVFSDLPHNVFKQEAVGALAYLQNTPPAYTSVVHSKYNPLAITSYNIVPGLLGVVLTMTLVVITSLAITREFERGTMENLLATPLRPLELMIGKIIPYIIVGYLQVCLVLLCAYFVFGVPIEGNVPLLLLFCLPYFAANLSMGLMFSTIATNQLQAVQSAMFFFLPSILLSGFISPFHGMPAWAQWLGNLLPITHFLLIVRGILLKGIGLSEIWHEVIPIILFTIVVMTIAIRRYRRTLD
jgi:ABC-2 type transport system permease protein